MSVIVDKNMEQELFEKLEKLNVKYYKSCTLDGLPSPINTHPDMQIHFISKNSAVTAPSAYEYYRNLLPNSITLIKGEAEPLGTYPLDCAYNVAKLGKRIIGNHLYSDAKLKELYNNDEPLYIDVKQGYAKCNLCIVSQNAVITEDEGLYRCLFEYGIDVLKLTPGSVTLEGFDHGFIGGASGFITKNTLAFCGKLESHPEYQQIYNFVKKHEVDIISLSSTKLKDFGSILYFEE